MPRRGESMPESTRIKLRAAALSRDQRGARNPNWKGGQVAGVDGRILVYCPGDPEAKMLGGTHALRYRLVARKKIGRELLDNEVVHHINGDPTDDRPENLEVIARSAHASLHAVERKDPHSGRFLPKQTPEGIPA